MKTCTKCHRELPPEAFYARRPDCKECVKGRINAQRLADPEKEAARSREQYRKHHEKRLAYHAEWRAVPENREARRQYTKAWREAKPELARDVKRKWSYGLAYGDYAKMLAAQDGNCAICGTADPVDKSFHVDHDHSTGSVRGLLCKHCNLGLGHFKDDSRILEAASKYISTRTSR